jgi:hypothetical protein
MKPLNQANAAGAAEYFRQAHTTKDARHKRYLLERASELMGPVAASLYDTAQAVAEAEQQLVAIESEALS